MSDTNSAAPFEQELLGKLAHIEELTVQELIGILKEILNAVGTGYNIDSVNTFYQHFYEEVDRRLVSDGQPNPNPFTDLWEFHQYWKANDLSTYASRRAYVAGLYKVKPSSEGSHSFWQLLHPDIVAISKSRYESGHHADSVEAAFKEINSRVKATVKQLTGKEYDGADLMNRTFSPTNPLITLDDLTTEDGKNIQQGYMQIFAGSMTGIRNPKAHSNVTLKAEEAIPFLFLASLLLTKYEVAKARVVLVEPETSTTKRLYLRLSKTAEAERLIELKDILIKSPGKMETILVIGTPQQVIRLPHNVNPSKKLLADLATLLGDSYVKVH